MSYALPIVEELALPPPADEALLRLAALPHCVFFDSAMHHATLGRYSFLSADPFDWIESPADGSDGLALLAVRLADYRSETVAGLPPFQGGAAGMFGYALRHSLERLPESPFGQRMLPALAVGFYDVVLAFDHVADRAWLVSQGWPEREPRRRWQRATERLRQFRTSLEGQCAELPAPPYSGALQPLAAPQHAMPGRERLLSNFSPEGYLAAVQRIIDYIGAGDVFQVNLSQQLSFPAREHSLALYRRLRQQDRAPFAGYFDLGAAQLLSASPERFLHATSDGRVETRPIKGTRRRTGNAAHDDAQRGELLASEKDRAENVMIVDLLRNDLSRVCQAPSVQVRQLCSVEEYEHVMHLVSAVVGQLRGGATPCDLLRACFPGGSITGAPKIRAMEIIAELEPTARGAYCGALGYLGFDGAMDTNILIRTITAANGWWQFSVGGGVVAQSDPQREYDETWAKAEGLLRAVGAATGVASTGIAP
jgi:para-aminobenzoate synthetase component 1